MVTTDESSKFWTKSGTETTSLLHIYSIKLNRVTELQIRIVTQGAHIEKSRYLSFLHWML